MKDFLNKYHRDIHLFSIPFLLAVILVSILIINGNLQLEISKLQISQSPVSFSNKIFYPFIKNSVLGVSTNSKDNSFSAEAAIVIDSDSKVILFAKNETLRFSMASTTKIMTALVGIEYFKPDDIVTVKEEGIEGAVVGFKKGERFHFADVLYAMLLPSGNDAAFTIAQNYPSGENAFIEKMNEKAQSLYLYNTHFSDPAGLTDEEDYTTPHDLAFLASEALKNPTFSEAVSTKHRVISSLGGKSKYSLYNLNKLLDLTGVTGVKTGYTEEAKGVLVTSKVEGGHTLIIVVMRSQDRFADTERLLNLVSGNIIYKQFTLSSF